MTRCIGACSIIRGAAEFSFQPHLHTPFHALMQIGIAICKSNVESNTGNGIANHQPISFFLSSSKAYMRSPLVIRSASMFLVEQALRVMLYSLSLARNQ